MNHWVPYVTDVQGYGKIIEYLRKVLSITQEGTVRYYRLPVFAGVHLDDLGDVHVAGDEAVTALELKNGYGKTTVSMSYRWLTLLPTS